jgi:hypothetical protein
MSKNKEVILDIIEYIMLVVFMIFSVIMQLCAIFILDCADNFTQVLGGLLLLFGTLIVNIAIIVSIIIQALNKNKFKKRLIKLIRNALFIMSILFSVTGITLNNEQNALFIVIIIAALVFEIYKYKYTKRELVLDLYYKLKITQETEGLISGK